MKLAVKEHPSVVKSGFLPRIVEDDVPYAAYKRMSHCALAVNLPEQAKAVLRSGDPMSEIAGPVTVCFMQEIGLIDNNFHVTAAGHEVRTMLG